MKITKDNPCFCELSKYLGERFLLTRNDLNLSQMEFANELSIDRRSYIDIEHRKNLCCIITFLAYLCYHCEDVLALLDDCREILDKYFAPLHRRR